MSEPTFLANLAVLKNNLKIFLKSNFIQSFLEGGGLFCPINRGQNFFLFINPKVPNTMG